MEEPLDPLLSAEPAEGEIIWKTFRLTVKTAAEDGTFDGYASVFGNVDSDQEVIDKGAFAHTIADSKGVVPVLWQHDRTKPCGWNKTAEEDNRGLKVHAQLLIDTEFGRYAHSFVKTGLDVGGKPGLSIGFRVPKGGDYFKDGIRHFREVALIEYSIVTFPANDQATATSAKGAVPFQDLALADEKRTWNASAADGRVRSWAGGPDKEKISWAKYKRAFLWFDAGDVQNFGSYKLPIADVIDGKLTAIPRAIYAAAGGHGVNNTDIPEADKSKVRAVITRYYKKIGKDSPFKSDGEPMQQKTHFKAEDFNSSLTEAVALSDLNELRWTMESALRDAIHDICEDDSTTLDDKKASIATSMQQYAAAMASWWSRYLDITMADDEGDEDEDPKSLKAFTDFLKSGSSITLTAKQGRAISAATKSALMKAVSQIYESQGHSKMSAACKANAIGILTDLSEGTYRNDVNKPNPVGGGKSASAPVVPPAVVPPSVPPPAIPAADSLSLDGLKRFAETIFKQ